MNGIVRFGCGCVGIVLPQAQQQSRGEGFGSDNIICLHRCDGDQDQPDKGFWFRHFEQAKIDGAVPLTADELKELAVEIQLLICHGHSLRTIRVLLRN